MKDLFAKFLNNNLQGKNKKFNDIKLCEIVVSLIFIIFGIILLLNKTVSDSVIAIFLGIIILLEAIINIYSSITKNSNSLFKLNIVFGVIYILIAMLLFTNFIKFLNYLVIYFGAYLIIAGIKEMITAIRLKISREDCFLIVCVMAIITISLGVLIIFYPFVSFGIIETIAIFAILYGILNINISILLRNRVEKFLSKVDNN